MKTLFAHQTILVLAPHTDDAELGCGGTIARLLEEGKEVHVAAFSGAKESLPPGSPPHRLIDEFYASMRTFKIPQDQIHFTDYPVRNLDQYRQEILERLITLKKHIAPDLVIVPSRQDEHQDHQVLAREGSRAFKEISMWGYELPWNTMNFSAQAFVGLDRAHLETKWDALQAYESQLELSRPYFSWEFVESLASVRGTQIKTTYAEAFEVNRIRF